MVSVEKGGDTVWHTAETGTGDCATRGKTAKKINVMSNQPFNFVLNFPSDVCVKFVVSVAYVVVEHKAT